MPHVTDCILIKTGMCPWYYLTEVHSFEFLRPEWFSFLLKFASRWKIVMLLLQLLFDKDKRAI